MPEFGK